MKRYGKWACWFIVYSTFVFLPIPLQATPISTFVTHPVAKGGYFASVRYQFQRYSSGPLSLDLNLVIPQFAYGITNRLTFITAFPVVISDFDAPPPIPSSSDFGLADMPALLRIDILKKHWVGQNLGFSLLAGLEIPSGDGIFSSRSVDFPFGTIFTWQTTGNEIDWDVIYQINTEGAGTSHGDTLQYDVAYSRRLLPWTLPEKGEPPVVWNIVFELNGKWARGSSLAEGGPLPDTGGHVLYFLSGFEWIFKNNGLQLGAQVPVHQSLNGNQLESQFNLLLNWRYSGSFF